jgi:hypothetical protein
VVFASATVMAVPRFARDWHLLLIAVVTPRPAASATWSEGAAGGLAAAPHPGDERLLHRPLLTGFYVDNGPNLPLWNRLPTVALWVLPSLVGVPLVLRALAGRRLVGVRRAPRGRPGSGAAPGRPRQAGPS